MREKDPSVASCTHPYWRLALNPGTWTDRESYQRPFTLQDDTQQTEPRRSGEEGFLDKQELDEGRGIKCTKESERMTQ